MCHLENSVVSPFQAMLGKRGPSLPLCCVQTPWLAPGTQHQPVRFLSVKQWDRFKFPKAASAQSSFQSSKAGAPQGGRGCSHRRVLWGCGSSCKSLTGWKAWRREPADAALIFSSTCPTCGSCHMLLTKEDILVERARESLSGTRRPLVVNGWVG